MAVRYNVTFTPIEGPVSSPVLVAATGIHYKEKIVANTETLISGENQAVLQKLVANTVQASAAQRAGLVLYLTAIEEAQDTSSVETAIGLL